MEFPKNELTIQSVQFSSHLIASNKNTWWTFLKMWDQMKTKLVIITSLHSPKQFGIKPTLSLNFLEFRVSAAWIEIY
jgi:hypothetical protein